MRLLETCLGTHGGFSRAILRAASGNRKHSIYLELRSHETWWSAQDYAPGLVRLKGGCATLTLALH